ncbi:MAG: hypothetical protein CML28_00365 [Rhizobiales bacterium]|nr:hypothetical protein [Hyphomicrobiales bacterium]|tara:strand:+ start:83 stop:580 length:498 start_codon:yes stop_codon:yes gene_type:complete
MHNVLRQLLLIIFVCCVSTQSISSEKIKSLFSNSVLNIESSSLEIIDSEKKAIFKGQVRILNEDALLATDNLMLLYSFDDITGDIQVEKITCEGNVLIEYESQVITSLNAVYDAKTNQLVFSDEVIISRDEGNAIKADKVSVDLNTMRIKMDSKSRVKAFITPNN